MKTTATEHMYNQENLAEPNKTDSLAPQVRTTLPSSHRDSNDIATGNAHSNPGQDMNSNLDSTTIPNLEAVKARQKTTWESGDFGQIARTIENVAEEFMAGQPLQPGSHVLDVACGTGNLAVLAARRGCVVSGVDIASNLIAQARTRAAAEGLRIDFKEGDAEALPFVGDQFDLVVSMFGVMFAPRPNVVAAELLRVTKPGGQVALASWTPEGFLGKMFNVFKAHLPPPPAGVPSPMGWGDEATVRTRLRHGFSDVRLTRRIALMRYPFPPAETVEFFRQYYGPTQRAFASLDASAQAALRRDLVELQTANNIARTPGTTEVAAEYLEVVAVRS
jgi:2-polyprenyl-3-methyl-5-hydroxy-6-metoxy-1,4-benzoquinol methylase